MTESDAGDGPIVFQKPDLHLCVQEERQRLAAGMAAAVAHTSGAPSATTLSEQPPPPPQEGPNGEVGGGEDSLLADADFSRFILGEDPQLDGGYGSHIDNDDYDPEHPF